MTESRSDESTPSKPRGLWSLMGSPATPPRSDANQEVDQKSEAPAASSGEVSEKSSEQPSANDATPRQRGLWGMMGQGPGSGAVKQAGPSDSEESPEELPKTEFARESGGNEPRSPAPRGLFALMDRADEPKTENTAPSDDEQVVIIRRSASLALPDEMPSDSEIGTLEELDEDEALVEAAESESAEPAPTREPSLVGMQLIDPNELEPSKYRLAAERAQRQGWISLACGVFALSTSALSLLPNIFASLPASFLGFAAIILGYLSLTGTGRRDISKVIQSAAVAGMMTGVVGIFLGPLVFSGLGKSLREFKGQQLTRQNLNQISNGLEAHYKEHEGFPIGGVFARDAAGIMRGQHGWMTFLLPYVGEVELYKQIDQSKPFDDVINRGAMSVDVKVYFAAGGDQSKFGPGFAVSHYAGVGGEVDEGGKLSHLGIFERDVAIKRDEITDGLANTLIIGELAGKYPPWGDPENWRSIGRGLNEDDSGFGNSGATGATFLFADGSIKYFSNKTDLKLLQRLSTRDGGE